MTKIAIVTVDYNNHKDTDEYLNSSKILDTSNLDVLWLVVDNGSDQSVADVVNKYPGYVWMQTGKNLGFAGGFNRGIKYAKEWGADFVLIINNDTLFSDKNLLKKMLQVFKNNPKAGVVSPKILFAPEYEFYKERYDKSDRGKIIWYAGGTFDWDNVRSIHRGIDDVDKGQYDLTEKTDFVSGCCVLVKREILEKVGYFEDKLFAYYEDSDWIERIKKAGYERWYEGNSFIHHKVSRTSVAGSDWSDYLITRNRLWFGMKYAPNRTKLALSRESIRLLFFGRKAQKDGIIDYFKNIWGWKNVKQTSDAEYPIELSIIIINYKTTNLTIQLLKGIYNGKVEVIVLDNSSEDSCKNAVIKKYPQIKFIQNNINNGFSGGNNQMINYALGENILLLNSDIKVKPSSITNIIRALKKYGNRSIYSGKLFFPNGKPQDSCFRLPTAWGAFKQYFLNSPESYFMYSPSGGKYIRVEGAIMACFLIPRRVINEIGALEEKTFMYFEDVEYCRRAKINNIPVFYVTDSEYIHYHGQSSNKVGLYRSNERLVNASKLYFGPFQYLLITTILWTGQKWRKIINSFSTF